MISMDATLVHPPAKRPRTDDGASSSSDRAPRRSEFWFEDANIILEAEKVQFGVHKGVLKMHSEVFKDMLHFGQPG